jgi:hypothetical protein
MNLRFFSPSLLVLIFFLAAPLYLYSLDTGARLPITGCNNFWSFGYNRTDFNPFLKNFKDTEPFEVPWSDTKMTIVKTPTDGGIRENIPEKYRYRFEKWKTEFLSTEFGRRQWDKYAHNKQFILTIEVTDKKGKGAGTDRYLWNDEGQLVGATISFGDQLQDGYPNPIYYPVMNSLSTGDTYYSIGGTILAAAKISHEIGHVNQTSNANAALLQLQNKLMPVYTSIFLKNGYNINDKKLVDLATQMGGTPIEIWESREYWSEVNAMQFLKERINKESFYCFVFNKIRRNLETYAKDYESRFDQHSEISDSPCWK